jgi:erythronate-4-phosphate dehydrogenase
VHTPLAELAAQCDIITFHTPLTRRGEDATYHLANASFFASLKRRPILINSSRGEVVDNAALVQAIKAGAVRHTVIDTWEGEPHLNLELLRLADIATPHIAGYSADGKANATRMSLQAVCEEFHLPFTLDIQPPSLPDGFHYGEETDGPLRLYDPRVDSARLKASPTDFERLRGNYPLRREVSSTPRHKGVSALP